MRPTSLVMLAALGASLALPAVEEGVNYYGVGRRDGEFELGDVERRSARGIISYLINVAKSILGVSGDTPQSVGLQAGITFGGSPASPAVPNSQSSVGSQSAPGGPSNLGWQGNKEDNIGLQAGFNPGNSPGPHVVPNSQNNFGSQTRPGVLDILSWLGGPNGQINVEHKTGPSGPSSLGWQVNKEHNMGLQTGFNLGRNPGSPVAANSQNSFVSQARPGVLDILSWLGGPNNQINVGHQTDPGSLSSLGWQGNMEHNMGLQAGFNPGNSPGSHVVPNSPNNFGSQTRPGVLDILSWLGGPNGQINVEHQTGPSGPSSLGWQVNKEHNMGLQTGFNLGSNPGSPVVANSQNSFVSQARPGFGTFNWQGGSSSQSSFYQQMGSSGSSSLGWQGNKGNGIGLKAGTTLGRSSESNVVHKSRKSFEHQTGYGGLSNLGSHGSTGFGPKTDHGGPKSFDFRDNPRSPSIQTNY